MFVPRKNIPVYDFETEEWSTRSFDSQIELGQFLYDHCFKEPGQYGFDKDIYKITECADKFTAEGRYTDFAEGTSEYFDFWDKEELKCRLGVIWKRGDRYWYTTRDYYFLLNYCPIINKEKRQEEKFCSFRDVQYYMMIYEKIAECFHLHSVMLKRRQCMYSFCHVAKSVNFLYFENNKRIKWAASDDKFLVGTDSSWAYLDIYKKHLSNHTDWVRPFDPESPGEIQQRYKTKNRATGKWDYEGSMSSIKTYTTQKDAKSPVGGPTFYFWYEEGGIAPTADQTLQYMDPALISGNERVGSFAIGGSVGDLSQCKPLKSFMTSPKTYGFFEVDNTNYDKTGKIKKTGLFIPAQWGMPEATDEFGNSLPEKALELLAKAETVGFKAGENGRIQDEDAWINLPPADYAIKKSQNPKTMEEAFAWRKQSFFNAQRVERRQKTIEILKESGELEPKQGLLEIDRDGKIILKPLSSFPEHDRPTPMGYPVDPKQVDKRGCVTIFIEPDEDVEPGTFFAGVDSVEVGPTTTSDSLMSVHIYKRGCKIISVNSLGEQTITYERGKIAATYTGRFNNPKDHNEQGLLLLRKYKALAACERNKPNFINYCRDKGYGYLIARKSELPFDKDLDATGTRNDEYGVYSGNDGKLIHRIKTALYEYADAEIDTVTKKTIDNTVGEVLKVIRGYDLIDDYWLLEEMKLYNDEDNFDRIISAGLAIVLGVSRELDHEKTIYTQDKEDKQKPSQIKKPVSLLPSKGRRHTNLLKR